MEVILLEKIRNLGNTGEIVDVKDGYGRNFLLKTGKALRADKKNIEFVKRKKDEINKKNVGIYWVTHLDKMSNMRSKFLIC